MPKIIIHRGANQIGGVSVEISTDNAKVFIDLGANLPGVDVPMPAIDGLTCGDGSVGGNSALFLTHYHGDHIGLLFDVFPEVPVYMGKTAKRIYKNHIKRVDVDRLPILKDIKTFEHGDSVTVGDITVTALMIDHSAFDAYMFVIDAGGKRILHTGDFRLHGIRGAKTLPMLKVRAKDIDYIICEGTTISRDGEPPISEHELRRRAADMMKAAKYVFVLCSSTNIDRIGAFYHANPKGRLFVCDAYQKKQLETVRQDHADKSDFYNFKHVLSYAPNLDKLMEQKGFCMLVRQGEFFKQVMDKYKDDCLVIYSMWTGYLDDRAKNRGLVNFLAPYRYRVLHTGGHASPEDIKKLYETIKPKHGLIPIHTDAPKMFAELIPDGNVLLLNDGEAFCL